MPDPIIYARMSKCVDRLLSASFPARGPAGTSQVSVKSLAALILESLRQFKVAPESFGGTPHTLNAALKPFFQRIRSDSSGNDAVVACLEVYDTYRKRMAKMQFENVSLTVYLARLTADIKFGECLDAMLRHNLLPRGLLIPVEGVEQAVFRKIDAKVEEIRCFDPEELNFGPYPGDEIYFLSSGLVFDKTGRWAQLYGTSNVDNRVRAGTLVALEPSSAAVLIDTQVQNGPDHPWFPLSAMCSVTLVEHENGDTQRISEAFSAGYSAVEVLKAAALGTTAGAVGAIAAIPGLLASLAVALDGDDELGSVVYRIDDILTGDNRYEIQTQDVAGSHWSNAYLYGVKVSFRTVDVGGVPPPFRMTGPQNLHTNLEWAEGNYKIECAAQLRNIQWSATHTQLPQVKGSIRSQGQRQTPIRFDIPYGLYRVQVTAVNDADNIQYSKSLDVLFQFWSGNGRTRTHPN